MPHQWRDWSACLWYNVHNTLLVTRYARSQIGLNNFRNIRDGPLITSTCQLHTSGAVCFRLSTATSDATTTAGWQCTVSSRADWGPVRHKDCRSYPSTRSAVEKICCTAGKPESFSVIPTCWLPWPANMNWCASVFFRCSSCRKRPSACLCMFGH